MGGIKAVGYEAISNIINERLDNGKFKSLSDFLSRVNPKDINKLQLEGLVKAGAFDNLNSNRQSLFNSIPNFKKKKKIPDKFSNILIKKSLYFTRNVIQNKFFIPNNIIFPKSRIILENYFN